MNELRDTQVSLIIKINFIFTLTSVMLPLYNVKFHT